MQMWWMPGRQWRLIDDIFSYYDFRRHPIHLQSGRQMLVVVWMSYHMPPDLCSDFSAPPEVPPLEIDLKF
jgi:hypothetical protein